MSRIYSATYSNVPVYEYAIEGNHVMRRRVDNWINATHILKVAEYDKPTRTRILEREVQKGTHEKVQGGYGKYQGTWIPLQDGRALAERNGVLDKLRPIFDFVPGDRSPPPAPKHATAAKPKQPRATAASRQVAGKRPAKKIYTPTPPVLTSRPAQQRLPVVDENYEVQSFHQEPTPDQGMMMMSDDERMTGSQYSSRKRKRVMEEPPAPPQMSYAEQQHLLWTDELLDYFMLQNSNDPLPAPPEAPPIIDLNRPVDDKGHTPMHWAAAMGDLHVVNDLIRRGARIDAQSHNGETPLMRAVMFTNNWDKQTMEKLINTLHATINMNDWFGSTVFHHIAATTCSKSKYQCARYYLEKILDKLKEIYPETEIAALLDRPDHNGDTAIILAARYGARKCVRSLLNHGVSIDQPNVRGETADELIKELNARRRDRFRQASSSPAPPPINGAGSPTVNIRSSPTVLPTQRTPSKTSHTRSDTFFRSEAANILSSQLPTLISSRAEQLATALEHELSERESESQEAERLVEQRRAQLESLKQRRNQLVSEVNIGDNKMSSDLNDTSFDDEQKAELEKHMAEAERLLELEQAADLRAAVAEEELKLSQQAADNNGSSDTVDEAEKLHLAHALAMQQAKRRKLVSEVVAAQSVAASSGEKHDAYKRLIEGALGVRNEEVESVLPEILRNLEEGGGGGAGGVAGVESEGIGEGLAEVCTGGDGTPVLGGGMGFAVAGAGAGAGGRVVVSALRDEMEMGGAEVVGVMG